MSENMAGWNQTLTLNEIIEIGTQIGIKTGIEKFEQLKMESLSQRHNRRLGNTKLLLKNYRIFMASASKAVYKAHFNYPKLKDSSSKAINILEEMEYNEPDLVIESIRKSTARTAIIMAHVNKMLEVYKIMSKQSGDKTDSLRYQALDFMYINKQKVTIDEISEKMSYSTRQIERHIDDAIVVLSGLIFGIDSLNVKKRDVEKMS